MSILNNDAAYTKSVLGIPVYAPDATLPQSTAAAIFTVTGLCLITSVVGKVGTVIETQANNTKLTATPTTGTAIDMCAVLDITADEAGTLYSITGTVTDALQGTVAGAVANMAKGIFVNTGTIDLDCAASNTGSTSWTITYVPISAEANIVAA